MFQNNQPVGMLNTLIPTFSQREKEMLLPGLLAQGGRLSRWSYFAGIGVKRNT